MRDERRALAKSLGLVKLTSDAAFRPYREHGEDFARTHLASLAAQTGGHVGPGPASMVTSAALQLAASRFLFDQASQTGEATTFKQASQLADASRQNLLAAYELGVREAQARASSTVEDEQMKRRIEFQRKLAQGQ